MSLRRQVAVVVDSAASLPDAIAQAAGIRVVPMSLELDGRTYLDGQDLRPTDFYRLLRGSSALPTTSAPSPASFARAFAEAAETASSLLCVTVGSSFSSSFEVACAEALEIKRIRAGVRVKVLDSATASGGEGLVALAAARAAKAGSDLDKVEEVCRSAISRVRVLAYVDTLQYLWRSGRVPGLAYVGTSLLRIKPLFELAQGQVRNLARPRTANGAAERLLKLMREEVGSGRVHATVLHADAPEGADALRRLLEDRFDCAELFVSEFSPVMGAHAGPGLLGVAFWTE